MSGGGHTRRDALKLFSAGAAALVAGCRAAPQAVPYRDMPEGMVPGKPLYFATSLPLGGAGRGVLVESHQGRPTKVHGNAAHPGSLGGTDVFAEAAVLDLFDPSRPAAPTRRGAPVSWSALAQALAEAAGQEGAVLLTGPVGSPTMARQIGELLSARPGLRWVSYRAVTPELRVGSAQVWPDFERLDAVVSLGADPLGPGPGQVGFAKGWSRAKRARRAAFRSHVFEAGPTLTGAQADKRTAVRPSAMAAVAEELRAALEGAEASAPVAAAAQALRRAEGRAAVLVGSDQPAAVHAAAQAINARLSAPLRYLRAFDTWPDMRPGPVDALVADMEAGRVPALIVLGANPVYDLGDGFAAAMAKVPQRLHFSVHGDETAAASTWHGPLHHPLEDWSDLRSLDGTVGLVQPLIAPLHDSRSAHSVLARMQEPAPAEPLEILRATWAAQWGEEGFEERWMQALHDGVIAGTGPEEVGAPSLPEAAAPFESGGIDVSLRPSPQVFDGSFASNAWLQECPDPFTKQVWGNAAWLSPKDAREAGLEDGDMVALSGEGRTVILPAIAVQGQAAGSVTLHLGHGRDQAGPIGTGLGAMVGHLGRTVSLHKTGAHEELARVQSEFSQHGRDILRTAHAVAAEPERPQPATFYPDHDYDSYAWGMVIDTDACIGCNACMVACQSENNIPVVGPEEIRRGRNMHWMRVDRYEMEEGGHGFQPVPCMQCEKAPCEPVCPVEASVHDSEGLNVQVYNRCIGTRFCQANCPYKVRRFNFFDYAEREGLEAGSTDMLAALRNPDVSVRGRGVMEKCTYCVQRISSARREAKKDNRDINDGEVVTACQAACPAEAIRFGNLNDADAEVTRAKADPRHYALLEELGTRPRTTYLARIVPEDGEDGA
jgi:molybdopterin-containing oxidoreductase family iron-sulfur binding subunit